MGYRQIPQHKGEIIQYFGDGCLALFGSAFEYALIKVDRDPTSPDGYIFMARLHQALGDSERAIAIYEDLIDQGFTHGYITGNLIDSYIIAGRPDDALDIIDKILMTKDSIGLREKGKVLLFIRKWEEAEEFYLQTDNMDMDLALIHLNTGRPKSAVRLFKVSINRRLAISTDVTWYLRDLSRIYAAMGNFDKAYEYLDILDQRGDLHYAWIHVDPFFDRMRKEKRFQEYCKRIEEKRAKFRSQIENLARDVKIEN